WHTAYSLQPTAYSLQPTAYSLQPTAYSLVYWLKSTFQVNFERLDMFKQYLKNKNHLFQPQPFGESIIRLFLLCLKKQGIADLFINLSKKQNV
ncbi:hypothetical protein, partial [Histophilus somni]|uniref:hypothetical protein n=1 Tax=Histophilus somni TaxID=731 RepID=UPI001C4BBCDF